MFRRPEIHAGASRLVFLIGPFAFKFPHPGAWRRFLYGLLHNMSEATFSLMKDPRMCPVLFAFPGGFFNIMARAEPLRVWNEAMLIEVNELACESPSRIQVPAEIKHSSWGTYRGRLVAVDYGS